MASYTTNLNLKKPSGSEAVVIGDINGNMDTIDTAIGALNNQFIVATLSGTTNEYGNALTTYSRANYDLVCAWSGGAVLIPYASSTADGAVWGIKVLNIGTMAQVANTDVTFTAIFRRH